VLDGGRLVVRPPWEPVVGAEVELVIDPGQAFGTGAHATTRLCLELMLGLSPDSGFVDLGCGSGVLAIAAARLGWGPVVALDNDVAAVDAAAENALVNGVDLVVRRHDLRVDPPVSAPTVAANLLRPLLLTWASRLAGASDLPASSPAGCWSARRTRLPARSRRPASPRWSGVRPGTGPPCA